MTRPHGDTARCDEGRLIRRIDVKCLLNRLAEREKELEATADKLTTSSCACEIANERLY